MIESVLTVICILNVASLVANMAWSETNLRSAESNAVLSARLAIREITVASREAQVIAAKEAAAMWRELRRQRSAS